MKNQVHMRVFRGDASGGKLVDYHVDVDEGMVVLDVIHKIQAEQAPDLSCRWNCKAGKCGSCSAEVNGHPKLMCMTRMDTFKPGVPITVEPIKTFPPVKDIVADVSWNFEVNKKIPPFRAIPKGADNVWRMMQYEADRAQEFRKCIECFLCQDVCHILRNHAKHDEFFGPRFMVRLAGLEMNPIDAEDRIKLTRELGGIAYCNITKCCTEVCPEDIHITDNAIIPLKERIADRYYDPLAMLIRAVRGRK
ncbi:succinate dehydrogenase/fumarate reductase iron-sulfur subunit [bacterium]|nr:succinate dehydrogenase/fumarate reductase iron-sulfur subunit [bacterium]MBU1984885.1 succinate dehydrogenase/fumarate reductase iron-sulfur subunit [bacterium]